MRVAARCAGPSATADNCQYRHEKQDYTINVCFNLSTDFGIKTGDQDFNMRKLCARGTSISVGYDNYRYSCGLSY